MHIHTNSRAHILDCIQKDTLSRQEQQHSIHTTKLTGPQSVGLHVLTEPSLKDDEDQSVELLNKQINFEIIDFHTRYLLLFHCINQSTLSRSLSLSGMYSVRSQEGIHTVFGYQLGYSTAAHTHTHTHTKQNGVQALVQSQIVNTCSRLVLNECPFDRHADICR